jgi:diaminopimelate decarboxylase
MAERTAPARDASGVVSSEPGPWPASVVFGPSGLTVAGVSAATLAERFGTPLVVFDEDDLRERCRAAREGFDRTLYAVKAFTAHAVIRIALEEGLDLLAATGGEVEACLRAGAPASRVVLHGNNKSDEELALAVRSGLSLVIADGIGELRRLDAAARTAGRVQPVLLRIVPEVGVRTHEAIATGHEASKFGTPRSEAVAAVISCAELGGLRFDGLHAHIGSQVPDIASYLLALDVLVDLAAEIRATAQVPVALLDVGGGFAVTYGKERALPPVNVAAALRARLAERVAAHGLPVPRLVAEPGRALVANPALTLYRVGAVKRAGGRTLVAVDGGMSDNLRPMLYDARFTVAPAGALDERAPAGALDERAPAGALDERAPAGARLDAGTSGVFTLVGKHCESGDVLAEEVELPNVPAEGDLLALAATGAYTYSMASTYNRVGRPAVVGVRRGQVTPWLRREDAADFDRLEVARRGAPDRTLPPAGVVVRPATPADAGPFLEFWTSIVAEGRYVRSERVSQTVRVYRRRFRRSWTERDAQIMALERDRVVGHLFIQRESHPVSAHVATLGIAVAADHRGKGVGSALMAEGFAWARGAGVEKIVLSVYPHNTGAIALYRKFGFLDEGRLARQSRKSYGYEDEVLMGAWIGADVSEQAGRPR